ncbi:hypothetical protein SODALDRAFT_177043 [Sodiomyces alkalinus F11]|uniref:Uncharacterized protein n=1 Tax=Sodiomyces alkalinus (strain CBS 110278 / VKM F-3762 / F11) TaxID=1314773 RepID=A0A3N2PTT0_SODAK|nr:hypothetical protein SODALDRAFT_177043 [Sodiomyces alkalinus F11]ROT37915.1 hypothetical protein SODALDRAFT_177043 [Sodiomyces alkalinus F11]
MSPVSASSSTGSVVRSGSVCSPKHETETLMSSLEQAIRQQHVFSRPPVSGGGDFTDLNDIPQLFWGSDQARTWRQHYEDARITQSTKNFICMNHQLCF